MIARECTARVLIGLHTLIEANQNTECMNPVIVFYFIISQSDSFTSDKIFYFKSTPVPHGCAKFFHHVLQKLRKIYFRRYLSAEDPRPYTKIHWKEY